MTVEERRSADRRRAERYRRRMGAEPRRTESIVSQIIDLCAKYPEASYETIARMIGEVSWGTVRYHIKRLGIQRLGLKKEESFA